VPSALESADCGLDWNAPDRAKLSSDRLSKLLAHEIADVGRECATVGIDEAD